MTAEASASSEVATLILPKRRVPYTIDEVLREAFRSNMSLNRSTWVPFDSLVAACRVSVTYASGSKELILRQSHEVSATHDITVFVGDDKFRVTFQ